MRHPNSDLIFNSIYKYVVEIPKYTIHRLNKFFGKKTRFTIVSFQNQHLFYFDRRSIEKILNRTGYKIEFIATEDLFNKYRLKQVFKELHFIEGLIALFRHAMSRFDRGSECIVVASCKSS